MCAARKMNFLPFEDAALSEVESKFAWRRADVAGDRFPGLTGPFQALDFSDFLLLCRDDFPDDVAYVIAALLCETPELLESSIPAHSAERQSGDVSVTAAQDRRDVNSLGRRRGTVLSRARPFIVGSCVAEAP